MSVTNPAMFLEPANRASFAAFCRHLYARHLVMGAGGNASVRFEEGFLVTPSAVSLRDLTAESVLFVRAGETTSEEGRPSKELGMHYEIFNQRPEANVVCHVHGANIIAASMLLPTGRRSLPPLTPGFAAYAYPLPHAPFFVPGSPELAEAVRMAFSDPKLNALLLKNHGLITVGTTMAETLNVAEEVDETATIYLLAGGKGSVIPERDVPRIS